MQKYSSLFHLSHDFNRRNADSSCISRPQNAGSTIHSTYPDASRPKTDAQDLKAREFISKKSDLILNKPRPLHHGNNMPQPVSFRTNPFTIETVWQ